MISPDPFRSLPRRVFTGTVLTALLTAQGTLVPASAANPIEKSAEITQAQQAQEGGGTIRFTATVPLVTEPLPIFKLTPTQAPVSLTSDHLRALKAPTLAMEHEVFAARESSTALLRAYVDPKIGDAELLPNLSSTIAPEQLVLKPIAPEAAVEAARNLFNDTAFIPKDDTTLRIAPVIQVNGGAEGRPASGSEIGKGTPASVRLTFVPAIRYAAGLPVYGPGSHVTVAVDNNKTVQGFLRRWSTATRGDNVEPTVTAEQVQQSIRDQLKEFSSHATVTVNHISRAYYDGNVSALQPVYYFSAVIHPIGGKTADDRIIGYVPIGKTVEDIPTINQLDTTNDHPSEPSQTSGKTETEKPTGSAGGPPAVTLGEYANRDGSMLGMADQLLNGLSTKVPFISPATPIVRTQYYWAEPWEVVGTPSKSYLNAVNIAYTQPHGDWYINTTYSNYADLWDVHNIGTGGNPGYGAAAGGKLATWIIDSCEVVPSMYDLQVQSGNAYNAFTPWFPVFQGLHNVIGFRTEMWLFDGLNQPFGVVAGLGGDVNAAWFQEIAADSSYTEDNPQNQYQDPHLNNITVHMGRASTFIDARDLGQSIYAVTPQSASSTLWNFWMNN
jgi:Family of unknown function (DUF6345)